MQTSSSLGGGHDLQSGEAEPSPSHTPDSAGARFRKISSIAYHTSGLRESRERTPQRASKAFVIIIPPASFTQQHGQLGHTLSSGPRYRLSQGLLMPLFPTMYGQLAAIAREYNFPSTTGLCLYPHFVEDGVTMTPRISDETWPFIWSHVFEASPHSKSPISGKIEFDIDLRQARWYASWMASSHRDEHSFSANPFIAHSVNHERGESKTTFQDVDDREESHFVAAIAARHVPRKLSLVDRYDMISSRPGSRPASRSVLSPPEQPQMSSQVLSPITQEEEPKSARHELDDRVKSWRASAVLKQTPLAATGQTSLESSNMPNMLPIKDLLLETPDDEFNLADYTWSISSAGPNDNDPMSPLSWDRVPSVHIAGRMEGSVCLTPSDCTSFGPSDYTLPSPGPSIYRLPSPDIAYRMYEDMPPTPTTATSWGAPIELPPSPPGSYRAPSVDLGERLVFSRPVTPSTATSWGVASWPSSPLSSEYRPRSIHLDCGDFSRPVTPSTATSWGAPLSYPPSPTTPFYVSTPDAGHRGFENSDHDLGRKHAPREWPYATGSGTSRATPSAVSKTQKHVPWGHSWPFSSDSSCLRRTSTADLYRQVTPWALSWPYYTFNHTSEEPVDSLLVRFPSAYPRLVIYRPVYPHFDLYPAIMLAEDDAPGIPFFNLNPTPRLDATSQISPAVQPVVVKLIPCYPAFDLYPAIYPGNVYEIYPSVNVNNSSAISVEVAPRYPFFNLYPAIYPHVMPYPQAPVLDAELKWNAQEYPDFHLSMLNIAAEVCNLKLTIRSSGYPDFNIYPDVEHSEASGKILAITLPSISVTVNATYPYFNLYPAVYPSFELYPPVYPFIEVYPMSPYTFDTSELVAPGYPDFILYPTCISNAESPLNLMNSVDYPKFDLYPAVCLTTGGGTSEASGVETTNAIPVKIEVRYPAFDLYPAAYPHFNIWPAVDQPRIMPLPKLSSRPTHSRLTHSELHAMVMMERIGSTGSFRSFESSEYSSSHPDESHDDDLRHAVSPGGAMATPNGTLAMRYSEFGSTDKSSSDELLACRPVPNLPSSSARATPPSVFSQNRRLPPPSSSHGPRLSSAFQTFPTLDFGDDISPIRPSPSTGQALAYRLPQDVESQRLPGLSRPASLSSLVPELDDKSNYLTTPSKPGTVQSQRARVCHL